MENTKPPQDHEAPETSELLRQIDAQSRHIRDCETRLKNYEHRQKDHDYLKMMSQSLTWRALEAIQRSLGRLFPPATRRGGAFAAFLSRIKKTNLAALPSSPAAVETNLSLNKVSRSEAPLAVCTIASKNYLAYVRTFARSFHAQHPEIPVYVLLTDRIAGCFLPDEEPFHLIGIDELRNIPDPDHFCFKYNTLELNTAVKPYFFDHLFRSLSLQKLVYFDPDIIFFDKTSRIFDLLNRHSLVLTPHITQPYQDAAWPDELQIKRAGTFNLGFIAMASTPCTHKILKWWQERLYDFCYMDLDRGMCVDQSWMNFIPAFTDDYYVLRNPKYNIAYWNLHERGTSIRFEKGRAFYGDEPVVFFHFSGFNPHSIRSISRHQDRYTLADLPNLEPLFQHYRDLLMANSHEETRQWPYAFGYFSNCVPIPPLARRLYGKLGADAKRFGNPFCADGKASYYEWLRQPELKQFPAALHRKLWAPLVKEIYLNRHDLKIAFPEPLDRSAAGFADWLEQTSSAEHNVHYALLEPALQSLRLTARFTLKQPLSWIYQKGKKAAEITKQTLRSYVKKLRTRPDRKSAGPMPFGANILGYLKGEFSIGEIARGTAAALKSAGVPMTLNNLREPTHRHHDSTPLEIKRQNPYRFNLIHVNADQTLPLWHQMGKTYFQNRYNIGIWFWELAEFPQTWRAAMRFYDEIWVASRFCLESLAARSPVPVRQMDFPVLGPLVSAGPIRRQLELPQNKFLFLTLFDFRSFEPRKNPRAVIEAFRRAFPDPGQSSARLIIKTINGNAYPAEMSALKQAAHPYPVHFLDRCLDRQWLYQLMASCDCYISLHRSEGFGIPLRDSMALGKPVIATNYSGNCEFMNSENSLLVRYSPEVLKESIGPYSKGAEWANPDIGHAAKEMRWVFHHPESAAALGTRASKEIMRRYSPEACGLKMTARLKEIIGRGPSLRLLAGRGQIVTAPVSAVRPHPALVP